MSHVTHQARAYLRFQLHEATRIFHSSLDGMLVSRIYPLALNSPAPIYTPGWREALWE